ncbi:Uncharacterised protein [Legionella cincinnatiensis]|uniref:Leucine rich repeat protein n=1 Tax=Legionella cincinnatiensis TaxID=28085 RepID=A0A378II12_9GAMM|nr:hypothetical protein Lcin_1590 [Legionella cincinnatiensis]STX34570.1 Uncharacterised protein [Legionella cincinnatiensis]
MLLYLDLRNNDLSELPTSLLQLKYLEKIDLRCNHKLMSIVHQFKILVKAK